jgi:hypothetical protein
VTEIRECPALLAEFTCSMREDWGHDETRAAILACKTAGLDWGRITRGLVDLALRDEEPPTEPRDLWARVRGLKSAPGTGAPLDPRVKERLFGQFQAVTDAHRNRATGPQPALTEDAERELLREGHDP